ncbi:MAG: hypothetical protein KDC44_16320 [Phaeodactylibacter sp.]|nr:hypothetical protein [Phaeodactylibacter sp.]
MPLKTYLESVQDHVRTLIAHNEHESIFAELMEVFDQFLPDRTGQQLVQFGLFNKAKEEKDSKLITDEALEISYSKATLFLTEELDALIMQLLNWTGFKHPKVSGQLDIQLKAFSSNLSGLKMLLLWVRSLTQEMPAALDGPTVTVLYAQEDKTYAYQLKKALFQLEKQGYFQLVDLTELLEGQTEIAQSSKLTLLLISNSFMFRFFDQIEPLHQAGCRIVPILIGRTDLTDSVLGKLRRLPADGIPINECPHPEGAFTQIGITLREFFKEHLND